MGSPLCTTYVGAQKDLAKLAHLTPRAGGISLHHCLTVHGSIANQSDRPRRGLVFQYRADDAYQLAGTVWTDTGILMSGRRRGSTPSASCRAIRSRASSRQQ